MPQTLSNVGRLIVRRIAWLMFRPTSFQCRACNSYDSTVWSNVWANVWAHVNINPARSGRHQETQQSKIFIPRRQWFALGRTGKVRYTRKYFRKRRLLTWSIRNTFWTLLQLLRHTRFGEKKAFNPTLDGFVNIQNGRFWVDENYPWFTLTFWKSNAVLRHLARKSY